MRWLNGMTDSTDMNLSELWEIVEDRGAWGGLRSMGSQRVRHDSGTEQQKQCNCSKDKGQIPLCMTYRAAQHLGPA